MAELSLITVLQISSNSSSLKEIIDVFGIASSTDWVLPDIICSKIISIDSFVILPWLRNLNDLIISSDFNKLASKSRLSRFVIVEQSIDATKLGELFLSIQIFSHNSKYSESKICSAS